MCDIRQQQERGFFRRCCLLKCEHKYLVACGLSGLRPDSDYYMVNRYFSNRSRIASLPASARVFLVR
jgi:hypothetical protein